MLEVLYLTLVFLHSLNFALNPTTNAIDFVHALVLNSFLSEEKIDDWLISSPNK